VRRAQPAFHPNAPQRVIDLHPSVFALVRGPFGGQTIVALHNTSAVEVAVDLPQITRAADREPLGPLRDLLSDRHAATDACFTLGPYGVAWLTTD
jgi:sucrose phosphorylase